MLGPAVEAHLQRIGPAWWPDRMAALSTDLIEECRAPGVLGQESVEVATDRPVVAPSHLRAHLLHEGLPCTRSLTMPVVNLVAGQGSSGERPGALERAKPGRLLALEGRADRQEPQAGPECRSALGTSVILELLSQHLISAAQSEHPRATSVRLADGSGDPRGRVVQQIGDSGLGSREDEQILLDHEAWIREPGQVDVRLGQERGEV